MTRAILATILLVLYSASADARGHRHHRHHVRHHVSHHRVHGAAQATALGGRQPGYPGAWCGAWMADHLGVTGEARRQLWLARNWATLWGHRAEGPAPGVVGVKPHNVFQVIRVTAPGRVLAISGNDGRAVRVRERSTAGVIAWRAAG